MVQTSGRWRSGDKHRAFIPVIVIVAVLVIGISTFMFLRSTTPAPTVGTLTPSLPPPSVHQWRIDLIDSKKQAQRFDASYRPGQVCYIPAGSTFSIKAEPHGAAGMFVEKSSGGEWDHEGGELNPGALNNNVWEQQCKAPSQPGLYRLEWKSDATPLGIERPSLDVLVLAPAEAHVQGDRTNVKVNGKSIGNYLDPTQSSVRRVRENAAQYRVPEFFAMLTPETINLKLGPDFDLGQLVAFKDYHGPDGKKVYTTIRHTDVLAIHPQLIDKLIKLRQRLREKGVKVTKFWITSGFRTPDYNKSIGGASYSRHCYGDAVDLCIDEDDDKKMDDLNGDGRIDRKDGLVIANACRELELEGAVVPGGIGVYEWQAEDSVGSHVHIDCRGYISRWGQIGSGKTKKSFLWWPKAEFQEDDGE
jgi:hypothetical protein